MKWWIIFARYFGLQRKPSMANGGYKWKMNTVHHITSLHITDACEQFITRFCWLLKLQILNQEPKLQLLLMSTWHIAPCGREGGEGRKWTSYDGQYEREAPPERGTLFRLHVYKGCWSAFISLLKYFEPNTPYGCLNLIYETYLRGAPF